MKRIPLLASLALAVAVSVGCATLDAKQREWIFQPSDRSWGEYLHEVHEMRARPVGRAPSIGIKVAGPNAGGCA